MTGAETRRSGRAELARGALGALAPVKWQPLCNIFADNGKPVARTVRVSVARSENDSDALANTRLPAGVWWKRGASVAWVGGGTSQCNGALRFRFGSQGAARVLVCDLASGDYQVPSCEHLYVEATRYTPGSDAAAIAALGLDVETEVQAEISDGTSPDFSPMLVTAPSSWTGGADASAVVAVAPGAYAFDLYADSVLGADNVFEVSPPGARRDFANSVLQPNGPLPVVSNLVTVQARGAAPVSARLVFFVR
jgi:hypothetical protein